MKGIIGEKIKQNQMVVIAAVIILFFEIATKGVVLLPQNVTNLILQNAYIIILSVGMMCCILTGGNVDLSVGSLCAFNGGLCGYFLINKGWNTWLVLAMTIGIALATGIFNGLMIAKFNVPSFTATLSSQMIFRGLTYIVLKGHSYTGYPENFLGLTTGYVKDFFGGNGLHITTIVVGVIACLLIVGSDLATRRKRKRHQLNVPGLPLFIVKNVLVCAILMFFTISLARYKGIPVVAIPVLVIVLLYSFITKRTVVGRHLYAVGGNPKAARLSGINDKLILFTAYVNMALLAGIAGIVFTARMNSSSPMAGTNFECDAIAACFIGGAAATGGAGTIVGAVIGALVIGILNNGMSILGMQSDVQMVVKGLVLLAAVVLDLLQKNKS